VKEEEVLDSYQFTINDKSGEAVYEKSSSTGGKHSINWDGTSNDGERVSDGEYKANLAAVYTSGDEPSISTDSFFVDTEKPSISLSADYKLFSPNDDGRKDEITIEQDSSREDLWEAEIIDADGNPVIDKYWKGKVENFTWNGDNENGETAADGTYTYKITAVDKAGNSVTKQLKNIQIDTKTTPIYISADVNAFSPNGDGRKETARFNLYTEVEEGLESWEVAILHASDESIVKLFKNNDSAELPETIQWDGTNEEGETAPEGEYVARLTITYENGNQPREKTESAVKLDITEPTVNISVSPKPFSPDGDGVDDTVTIDIKAEDDNKLTNWDAEIYDPEDNLFYRISGEGSVDKSFTWDGKSEDGELVQAASDYRLEILVKDQAGNVAEKTRIIPVDVFIVEEDGKRKIKISSIIFPPDSPDHTAVDKEQRQKNRQVLDRIAEILKKYDQYQIRIDGYAVVEYWKWEGAAEWEQDNELLPLSEDRAESIRDALVERGISESRLSVKGYGGDNPVVPHDDIENRWKNRRVEFILTE
jgi:outer membrane protein OmpA-like peptidoglycan-associated protein